MPSLKGVGKGISSATKDVAKDTAKQTASEVATNTVSNAIAPQSPSPQQPTVDAQQVVTSAATTAAQAGVEKAADKAISQGIEKGVGKGVEKGATKGVEKGVAKAVPGLGTAQTVVSTVDSGANTVEGAAVAMDNTKSRDQQVAGQKQAIKGGVEVGATAAGTAIGAAITSESGGWGAAVGAQVGNVAGGIASPIVSEVAQPIADPLFKVGGKVNDKVTQTTGINAAKETANVAGTAATVTGGMNSISSDPMAVAKTAKTGDLSNMTGKHEGMLQAPKAEGGDAMMNKLNGMMSQKAPEVDPQALTQKASNGGKAVTFGANKAAEVAPTIKQQAQGVKAGAIKPEEPKPEEKKGSKLH